MIGDVIRNLFSLDDDDDDDEVCEALTPRRIMQEIAVFKRKNVPENEYHFFMDGKKPYAVFAAHPRENVYTLHMDLREFPNEPPKVFVTRMLRDYDGEKWILRTDLCMCWNRNMAGLVFAIMGEVRGRRMFRFSRYM